MARMLQALKNLEARSPRPAPGRGAGAPAAAVSRKSAAGPQPRHEGQAKGQTAEDPAKIEAAAAAEPAVETAPPPARPTRRPDAPPLAATLPAVTIALEELPKLQAKLVELSPGLVLSPARADFGAILPATTVAAPATPAVERNTRPACNCERLVRRTLSDPVRSQPFVQLLQRLKRDTQQTASKTLLLSGVGSQSAVYETLLHTAALLADESPRGVLLVDADLPRRRLTEAMEYGQSPGLAELLRNEDVPDNSIQPTASGKLAFLPAGLSRHVDLSTTGPRLETLLQRFSAGFSYVLMDGGRASDLAATVLARLADATYFVVQLGTVETSEAQAALRDFRATGARVLGCIAT